MTSPPRHGGVGRVPEDDSAYDVTSSALYRGHSRSPNSKERIVIKNRRKRYLDTHPDYLSSSSLELADPLAYDRLVRRFQTPSEREAEGRSKGYSGVLEADLWRSEAKVEALAHPDVAATLRYRRNSSGEIVAEERDDVPQSKEEGLQRWHKEMELRFLRGEDRDFDYDNVDGNEDYDDRVVQEREEEEKWFEEEEPQWTSEGENDQVDDERGIATHGPGGQTGIQDF